MNIEKIKGIIKKKNAEDRVKSELIRQYENYKKLYDEDINDFEKSINKFINDNNSDYLPIHRLYGSEKQKEFLDAIAKFYEDLFGEEFPIKL